MCFVFRSQLYNLNWGCSKNNNTKTRTIRTQYLFPFLPLPVFVVLYLLVLPISDLLLNLSLNLSVFYYFYHYSLWLGIVAFLSLLQLRSFSHPSSIAISTTHVLSLTTFFIYFYISYLLQAISYLYFSITFSVVSFVFLNTNNSNCKVCINFFPCALACSRVATSTKLRFKTTKTKTFCPFILILSVVVPIQSLN